jgi:hypothetical protein
LVKIGREKYSQMFNVSLPIRCNVATVSFILMIIVASLLANRGSQIVQMTRYRVSWRSPATCCVGRVDRCVEAAWSSFVGLGCQISPLPGWLKVENKGRERGGMVAWELSQNFL